MKLSPLAHQANAHDDAVWSVAWSGAGEGLLLTGSVDESVKAWRAAGDGLEMAHAYTGHTLGVVALAAAPNGLVASSALDSLIRVWSVDTHETRCVIETPPAENWQIAFAPGDEPAHLAVAGGVSGGVKLYSIDQDGGEQVSVMSLPEDRGGQGEELPVRAGERTASRSDPSNPRALLSVELEKPPPRFRTPSHAPTSSVLPQSVTYSPDGRRLACGAMDGTVALFDVGTGKLLHTLAGHAMPVRSLCFSRRRQDALHRLRRWAHPRVRRRAPQPDRCAAGTQILGPRRGRQPRRRRAVLVLERRHREALGRGPAIRMQTMSDQAEAVWGVCFAPGGGKVASVSDDKSVNLYDFV